MNDIAMTLPTEHERNMMETKHTKLTRMRNYPTPQLQGHWFGPQSAPAQCGHGVTEIEYRHCDYGVSIIGEPDSVREVMQAVDAHADLLQACQMLLVRLEEMPGLPRGGVHDFARAAIRKAGIDA